MAKEDGQSSQLNLTVVALVALVAIVGLVALVLNTAGLAKISTGSQVASADGLTEEEANAVGLMLGVNCGAFSAGQLAAMAESNSPVLHNVYNACA